MGRLYIYLHEWLIFMVKVGIYTSPMDPMGMFLLGAFFSCKFGGDDAILFRKWMAQPPLSILHFDAGFLVDQFGTYTSHMNASSIW